MKKHRVLRAKLSQKDDFDIDLEALTGSKPVEKADKREEKKPDLKPGKKVRKKTGKGRGNHKGGKRGHPIKGTLPPIRERPYLNPLSTYEVLKENRGQLGMITAHLKKHFKFSEAESVAKQLFAKRQLPKTSCPTVSNYVSWKLREAIRHGTIKVITNPKPKEEKDK